MKRYSPKKLNLTEMWQLYKELHIEKLDVNLPVVENYVRLLRGCSKRKILDIMGIKEDKTQAEFFYLFIEFATANKLPSFIKFVEDTAHGN